MRINTFQASNVRNLAQTSLQDLAQLNFFVGDNGAGKTSLLEAIAVVGMGRSFRTHRIAHVIEHNQDKLQVFAQCIDDNQRTHALGVTRYKNHGYEIRINHQSVHQLAALSRHLPLLTIDNGTFALLDGPSSARRRCIDWGAFHINESFYHHWKSFHRVLKQRNALLKQGARSYVLCQPWDEPFIALSQHIERIRSTYFSAFHHAFTASMNALAPDIPSVTLHYSNGWSATKTPLANTVWQPLDQKALQEKLVNTFARDQRFGVSHLGPHKADLHILINHHDTLLPAKDVCSRGQKKIIVAALILAQAQMLASAINTRCVLLLDDLASELDANHLQRFLSHLTSMGCQSFISVIDDHLYRWAKPLDTAMFHVERGRITPACI